MAKQCLALAMLRPGSTVRAIKLMPYSNDTNANTVLLNAMTNGSQGCQSCL